MIVNTKKTVCCIQINSGDVCYDFGNIQWQPWDALEHLILFLLIGFKNQSIHTYRICSVRPIHVLPYFVAWAIYSRVGMGIGVISDVTGLVEPVLDQQREVSQGRWGFVNYQ